MAPTFVSRAGGRSAPARVAAALRAALGLAVDVALPRLCPACREPVGDAGLCAGCWSKLSFIARPYCERLGIPFPFDSGPGLLSMEAIADPPAYGRARAAVRYDDVARTLVQAFKYGDRLDLAPVMGRWMANAGRELFDGADALVPVPLHWRRQWARRFNQSALLAEVVAQGQPPAGRLHGARSASRRRRSRSGCRSPSALPTCRAHSACPARASPRWRDGGSFWSTMC